VDFEVGGHHRRSGVVEMRSGRPLVALASLNDVTDAFHCFLALTEVASGRLGLLQRRARTLIPLKAVCYCPVPCFTKACALVAGISMPFLLQVLEHLRQLKIKVVVVLLAGLLVN
jgi:hypothetical protein